MTPETVYRFGGHYVQRKKLLEWEIANVELVVFIALENVQSELFDMKTKYDDATSAKYVMLLVYFDAFFTQ